MVGGDEDLVELVRKGRQIVTEMKHIGTFRLAAVFEHAVQWLCDQMTTLHEVAVEMKEVWCVLLRKQEVVRFYMHGGGLHVGVDEWVEEDKVGGLKTYEEDLASLRTQRLRRDDELRVVMVFVGVFQKGQGVHEGLPDDCFGLLKAVGTAFKKIQSCRFGGSACNGVVVLQQ